MKLTENRDIEDSLERHEWHLQRLKMTPGVDGRVRGEADEGSRGAVSYKMSAMMSVCARCSCRRNTFYSESERLPIVHLDTCQ